MYFDKGTRICIYFFIVKSGNEILVPLQSHTYLIRYSCKFRELFSKILTATATELLSKTAQVSNQQSVI